MADHEHVLVPPVDHEKYELQKQISQLHEVLDQLNIDKCEGCWNRIEGRLAALDREWTRREQRSKSLEDQSVELARSLEKIGEELEQVKQDIKAEYWGEYREAAAADIMARFTHALARPEELPKLAKKAIAAADALIKELQAPPVPEGHVCYDHPELGQQHVDLRGPADV